MTTAEILSLSISIVALVAATMLAVWAFRMRARYRANGKRLNALASRIKDGERGLLAVSASLQEVSRRLEDTQGAMTRRVDTLENVRSKIHRDIELVVARVRQVESDRTMLMRDVATLAKRQFQPGSASRSSNIQVGMADEVGDIKTELRMQTSMESLHRSFVAGGTPPPG